MSKIITPVVTVFDRNEKVDLAGNKRVIEHLISGGVNGILVLGSTGEFTVMNYEEKLKLFKLYAEENKGRVELYAGTNCPSIEETIKLSEECLALGYRGVMVIGPYYYGLDQEKIFIYYDKLAKSLKGDVFIYNFPARSGHSIAADTVRRLLEHNDNVRGLKDSVSEPGHTNAVLRAVEGFDFEVYSGFDDQYLSNLAAGGMGCIAALSNLAPELWADWVKATDGGDLPRTMALGRLIAKLMKLYDVDCNFAYLFKKLMNERGLGINETSVFPFSQMDDAVYRPAAELFKSVMAEYEEMK